MTSHGATITADSLAAWRAHIGRREIRRQVLDVESLRRFAASVGAGLDVERRPPPLAHWAYFLEVVATHGLAGDGHARTGGGLVPPITLPRRMFAASRMTFGAPLTLGHEAELTLTLADVQHKSGKSGDLVLVDVDRVVTQLGRTLVTERQTIVYRDAGAPVAAVGCVPRDAQPGDVEWTPGAVELFRFSAATYNAHRIHYDLPYARNEEGYPGLVVHGPLTAIRLFAFAQSRAGKGSEAQRFGFRAQAPLFAGQPVRLVAGDGDGQVDAMRCDGVVAMTARYEG